MNTLKLTLKTLLLTGVIAILATASNFALAFQSYATDSAIANPQEERAAETLGAYEKKTQVDEKIPPITIFTAISIMILVIAVTTTIVMSKKKKQSK